MSTNDEAAAGPGNPISPPWPVTTSDDRWTPFPWSYKQAPALIKELIGRPLRIVQEGESVPQDIVPGRVTILVGPDGKVDDIWVDPSLPDR